MELKRYKKEYGHSYTFGVFPTVELLRFQPRHALKVFIHSKGERNEGVAKLRQMGKQEHVEVEVNDKMIERLAPNENSYAVGVFEKYTQSLDARASHVALVGPSDMGNLGTIMRTMLGFGVQDLAIVRPAADLFDPRAVRASMGALFQLRCCYYNSFDQYKEEFSRALYPFVLNGKASLPDTEFRQPFTLVFGNEGAGLPAEFREVGTSVTIPHSSRIDSLNLPIAAGIALYEATKHSFAKP